MVVTAAPYGDRPAASLEAAVQAAALEMRIWEAMQDVKQLASKLYVGGGDKLTNEIFSTEVRRWSPDSAARAEVQFAAGSDPTLMRMVLLAGLLGDEATVAERTTEHLCSDALREVGRANPAAGILNFRVQAQLWPAKRFNPHAQADGTAGGRELDRVAEQVD